MPFGDAAEERITSPRSLAKGFGMRGDEAVDGMGYAEAAEAASSRANTPLSVRGLVRMASSSRRITMVT